MKNAFLKFSSWVKDHLPTKRRLIQVYAALLFNANIKGYISGRIYTGKTKYACVPGMNCYSCPGAVGSCPLGSLQNALASSGNTAPYYVIGILALFGLILGRTICGYLCPVGLGQELIYKLRTPKLKKNKFTRILSYLKYVLLIGFVIIIPILYGQQNIAVPGFCKYVCPAGTFGGGLGLLLNPSNQDYLDMLGPIFTWKFCLLMVIMAACVFCYRAFCRFLCPLGAIYGFFNRFAFIGVHVDKDNCTDCGLCVSHCKMDIRHVGDHECINCGECISVCPTKAISFKGGKLFLRRNEVDGGTEQPVLKLSASENESATDGSASDIAPSADNSSVTISAANDEAHAKTSSTTRYSVKIDGYAGLAPMTVPALALESAGISVPTLAPDTGLPSGGNATEPAENGQNTTNSDDDRTFSASSDENSCETPTSESHDKSATSRASSSASTGAKLKTAVRTPKFWMQCTAVFLALALLIGAFVYFNVMQKDLSIQPSVNEVYLGTYSESDGNISIDISTPDIGQVNEISLAKTDEGLTLTLTLSYKGNYDDEVVLTYSALLTKAARDAQIEGMYGGEIALVHSSVEGGDHTEEDNGVKNYAGESVCAILKGGNFALQIGNVGRLSAGMLINDFSLRLYQKDAQGNYSLTQNVFDLYEHIGEVTVINFWGTWCGPCVAELPSFETLKKNHPDVTVVAIHGESTDAPKGTNQDEYVSNFINEKGWGEILFAQDVIDNHVCQTFQLLGGKNAWPMTLIVDRFGRISFMRQGSLTYNMLEAEVTKLL